MRRERKIITYIYCCIVSLLLMSDAFAQDFHLSQYFASPLAINPALAGKYDGLVRATMNYRNQWPSINRAFITTTASAELKINHSILPENDAIGVGLLTNIDRVFNGILATNQVSMAVAYHKGLDGRGHHHLTGALQGTYTNKSVDFSQLVFEDQLAVVIVGGTLPQTGEIFETDAVNYFDFNAGLMYTGSTNGRNMYYIGGSLYHINSPEEHFTSYTAYVDRRYTLHAGGYLPLSQGVATHLSAMYMQQGGSYEIMGGGALETNLSSTNSNRPLTLYTGLWFRANTTFDAIIPYIGINYFDFRFGVSYDINISQLKRTSGYKGGIEFSLFYIFNPSHIKKMMKAPCGCPDF